MKTHHPIIIGYSGQIFNWPATLQIKQALSPQRRKDSKEHLSVFES